VHLGKKFDRLTVTLLISMSGYLMDLMITHWILSDLNGFEEANKNLLPELGLPLLVISYVVFDRIIPHTRLYNNVFYTLAILQWTGPVQNIMVVLGIIGGVNFFIMIPIVIVSVYLTLNVVTKKKFVVIQPSS
jgi:hypothetical protein